MMRATRSWHLKMANDHVEVRLAQPAQGFGEELRGLDGYIAEPGVRSRTDKAISAAGSSSLTRRRAVGSSCHAVRQGFCSLGRLTPLLAPPLAAGGLRQLRESLQGGSLVYPELLMMRQQPDEGAAPARHKGYSVKAHPTDL